MKLDFNKKYTTIAVYAFLVIAASITFFYLINEHTTVSRVLGMVFNLMMPFIYGAALAYILNPILNWLERKVFPKIFRDKLSRRGQRRLGVLISFLFAAAVVAVFLAILIPQLIESVDSLLLRFLSHLVYDAGQLHSHRNIRWYQSLHHSHLL